MLALLLDLLRYAFAALGVLFLVWVAVSLWLLMCVVVLCNAVFDRNSFCEGASYG